MEEQAFIHQKYVTELVPGQFLAQTREALIEIVNRMKERDAIDALILGGTELSLLFADASGFSVRLLDAAALHAAAIVTEMLN